LSVPLPYFTPHQTGRTDFPYGALPSPLEILLVAFSGLGENAPRFRLHLQKDPNGVRGPAEERRDHLTKANEAIKKA
jgi:hypothetical protein